MRLVIGLEEQELFCRLGSPFVTCGRCKHFILKGGEAISYNPLKTYRAGTCSWCDFISRSGKAVPYEAVAKVWGDTWCDSCRDRYAYEHSNGRYYTYPETNLIPDEDETYREIPSGILWRCDLLDVDLDTFQFYAGECGDFLSSLRDETGHEVKFARNTRLDSDHGIVITCRPWSLGEIRREGSGCPWRKILRWSQRHRGRLYYDRHEYRMRVFLNCSALTKEHEELIVKFFNKTWNHWLGQRFYRLGDETGQDWEEEQAAEERAESGCREGEVAVNLGDWIEVRLFPSPERWKMFVRNCEFVDAVRVYCGSCRSEINLTTTNFLRWLWLAENRSRYPVLARFLLPKAGRNWNRGARSRVSK